jgi:hypothetical protein
MFPEALALHYLDDLDSKMESMRAHFAREVCSEGVWTGYNPSLARPLLNTSKFLEKKPATTAEAVVHAAEPGTTGQERQSMPEPEASEQTPDSVAAAGPEKI